MTTDSPAIAPPIFDTALKRTSIVVVLGTVMSILDTTIVNVAIDTLGRDFHASVSTIQWVSTGYLLALATVIPLTGWIVERFGAKRAWIVSLTLFLGGSVLCGVSWSLGSLIVFRVLQGLGGGMILPIGQTILARQAGPSRMGRVMSVIGVPTLLGPILGPVLGGLILDNLSWRWIFFVNAPIGAVALFLAWRILSPSTGSEAGKLDIGGLGLLSPGLAILVYGLAEAGSHGGFTSATVLGCILGGLVLIAAFVVRSLRISYPLLDVRLFRDKTFTISSIASFGIGGAIFAAMFLLPLYYQVDRSQSALAAGLLMAPQGLGAMVMMPIAGRITDRSGARNVAIVGTVLMLAGTVVYTEVGAHTSEVLLALSLLVRGVGLGLSMMPIMAVAYRTLDRAAVPRATTLINIVQRVGGSVGTALIAVLLEKRIIADVPGATGALASGTGVGGHLAGVVAHAFGQTFWAALGIIVISIAPLPFLPAGHGAAEPVGEAPAPAFSEA